MTRALSSFGVWLVRHAVLWVVDAIALWLTALVVPGLYLTTTATAPGWVYAVAAAFLLGVVNLLIRPAVLLLARPLGLVAVLGIGLVVNALTLWITAALLPGFHVDGFIAALLGGFIFVAINTILTTLMEMDEEGSYYENRIRRIARRKPFAGASEPGVGLVMLEIDGLSYHHVTRALEEGRMPTLSRLMREEGYVLSPVDCGIPSQTSACQAGIMFGDNYDIPAFRWYDKDERKLYVSSSDAAAINARYAKGTGLMRGGASIDNMLNGDAEKSMLTLADLRHADAAQQKRRTQDVYLLCLNPYFLTRTFFLAFGAVGRELWEGWRQRRQKVEPRMNRVAHFYPFVRAATTVLIRDMAVQLTIMDVLRGAPSIYVTWPGYDEVAHHSGPWTKDAFGELARYDKVIARVHRIISEKAPRPYELVVLSDHGQSFGATFLQRYGLTLKELIEQHLPSGTEVSASFGGDTGVTTLSAAGAEFENLQHGTSGNILGRQVARAGKALLKEGVKAQQPPAPSAPTQVTAYGSGNLAQVYFDLHPRKIALGELNEAYPDMVDALVAHEGVGFVAGYAADGGPVVLGKNGFRDLRTGAVEGDDPLAPYAHGAGQASIQKRAWQVQTVMDFPHAGDLMVVSTVYPDGTVAALEELIGSHGGMGGEQTDAFLFHPPTITVPDTRNSTDVFTILNGRRGGPVAEKQIAAPAGPRVSAWSPRDLWSGIRDVHAWVAVLVRCAVLDPRAYRRVVVERRMTGPAVLIVLATAVLSAFALPGALEWWRIPLLLVRWWLISLAVFGAGRLLSSKGEYTKTFRALAFARGVFFIEVLAFIPGMGSAVRFLAGVLGFLSVWMAAAVAHEVRGWRTLLLAILPALVIVVAFAVIFVLLLGAGVTFDGLLQTFGFTTAS